MFSLGILLLGFGAIVTALGIVSLVISEISNSVSDKNLEETDGKRDE